MAYQKAIKEAIESFFSLNEWKFSFDESEEMFSSTVGLASGLGEVDLSVTLFEEGYLVYITIPMIFEPALFADIAEYIHRVNGRILRGCFEFDYDEGSVKFRLFSSCYGGKIEKGQVEDSVMAPLDMVDVFGRGLVEIATMGVSRAAEVLERVSE